MQNSAVLAAAYTREVTRTLSQAVALFPSGSHRIEVGGVPSVPPPEAPGTSALAAAASEASEQYVNALTSVGATDERVNAVVARAIDVGQRGRGRAEQVLRSFETRAAAISSSAQTPEGLRLLVATGNQHQEAMSTLISETKTSNAALATELHESTAQYRGAAPQPPGAPAPHDEFDLDTQYVAPAGLIGGGVPQGTIVESGVDCGNYVLTLTGLTTTYIQITLSQRSGCCP